MVKDNKKTRMILLAVIFLIAVSFVGIFFFSRKFLPWWLFFIPLFMLLMPLARLLKDAETEAVIEDFPEVASEKTVVVTPKILILITGPWAARWFDKQQTNIGSRFDHQITWLLTPSATDIKRRMDNFYELDNPPEISLFFPVLPDGYENEAIMVSQFTAWKNSLFCIELKEKIPCILALYARLSHDRKAHNPDGACWVGNFDLSQRKETTVTDAFNEILQEVESDQNSDTRYAEQRNAMITLLFSWLTQARIVPSLQSFFNAAGPITLSRVLVADHSFGFSRHGAWSNWICNKYGLWPGLASSLSRPPLPDLIFPEQPQQVPETQEPVAIAPLASASPSPAFFWLTGSYAICALFALMLLFGAWQQSETLKKAQENIYRYEKLDNSASAERIVAVNLIKQDKALLSECLKNSVLNVILPVRSQCEKLFNNATSKITHFYSTPFYRSVSLFSKNSATLTLESEESLTKLATLLNKNPELRLLIIGHSDDTGTPEFNYQLSLNRAKAVRDWLIRKTHSSESKFIIEGAADSHPITKNSTEEGRKLNRRVEIKPLP
ncbi:OmpA family protein [Pantoea sp.]|uniref:OmpA family protein n=1 Tax=Pantoea sp. TaxID=69393 RepID=UPI002897C512|nr:OmpA family protein [Pantoea sp.]